MVLALNSNIFPGGNSSPSVADADPSPILKYAIFADGFEIMICFLLGFDPAIGAVVVAATLTSG